MRCVGESAGERVTVRSAGPPASRLCRAALSTARGEPVSEFLLIPFGEVSVERAVAGDSFVFTRRHAESAAAWFRRMGRKLAIDYEHQTFDRFNTRSDGLRPAAGWIGRLEVREDGLWAAEVAWTERAVELLRSGEYRYFSPVVFWTDEAQSDVAALGPVALTNDPAMHGVQALAARRRGKAGTSEDGEDDAPGAVADVGREARADANTRWAAVTPAAWRRELEAAEEEIAVLRRRLALQAADAFVERGMRLGKIVDSTSMDWREDFLEDAVRAEERLSRAPVLLPPGRVMRLDARGQVRRVEGLDGAAAREVELHRRWGIEPADMEAYERAVASGRVRRAAGA